MSVSYYLVTKPLQYVNATNIEDNRNKVLLLVDKFYESDKFYRALISNKYWDKVVFFPNDSNNNDNILKAFDFLKKNAKYNDYIFLDNDQSLKKNVWISKLKCRNIYVYEEGVGSYRNDLSKQGRLKLLKIIMYKLTGLKHHSGGSKFVKGLYVYDINKHKNEVVNFHNERLCFKNNFTNHLKSIEHHFDFQLKEVLELIDLCRNKSIVLYLSSWTFDDNIYKILSEIDSDFRILKLHPHIQEKKNYPKFDFVLSNGILVELFILKALESCKSVTVLHYNSSALQYIDHPNLNEVIL